MPPERIIIDSEEEEDEVFSTPSTPQTPPPNTLDAPGKWTAEHPSRSTNPSFFRRVHDEYKHVVGDAEGLEGDNDELSLVQGEGDNPWELPSSPSETTGRRSPVKTTYSKKRRSAALTPPESTGEMPQVVIASEERANSIMVDVAPRKRRKTAEVAEDEDLTLNLPDQRSPMIPSSSGSIYGVDNLLQMSSKSSKKSQSRSQKQASSMATTIAYPTQVRSDDASARSSDKQRSSDRTIPNTGRTESIAALMPSSPDELAEVAVMVPDLSSTVKSSAEKRGKKRKTRQRAPSEPHDASFAGAGEGDELDPDVLAALPEDIRREVMAAHVGHQPRTSPRKMAESEIGVEDETHAEEQTNTSAKPPAKKRGRPKKGASKPKSEPEPDEESEVDQEEVVAVEAPETSPVKSYKKQRGKQKRSAKSDAAVVVDDDDNELHKTDPSEMVPPGATPAKPGKRGRKTKKVAPSIAKAAPDNPAQEQANEQPAAKEEPDDETEEVLTDRSINVPSQDRSQDDPSKEKPVKAEAGKENEYEKKDIKPAEPAVVKKEALKSSMTSLIQAKVNYRVGLSKTGRVPGLLKIVRK